MIPMFNAPPKSIVDIAGNYDIAKIRDLFAVIGSADKTLDFVRTMLTSAEDLLNEWFDSEFLKAPLARLASELGAPPSQKMLGIGAIMMAMRHDPGHGQTQRRHWRTGESLAQLGQELRRGGAD